VSALSANAGLVALVLRRGEERGEAGPLTDVISTDQTPGKKGRERTAQGFNSRCSRPTEKGGRERRSNLSSSPTPVDRTRKKKGGEEKRIELLGVSAISSFRQKRKGKRREGDASNN